ncbi:MAG TPA: IS4 family transposase [Stenomitos sp.]
MLPEFYLTSLESQLSASQLLTLEMLVWLLQFHKQVRIERLAACLPLPVLYESRRRHVQRFLILPQLSIPLLWFPLIKCILLTQISPTNRVIVALDRTQWKQNNLFVVSVIWDKRAWPIYWQFLSHTGSSNLAQQQALLRPVFRLLKGYEIVVIGDREFRSVELAYWLKQKKVYFALRLKQGSYIKLRGQEYQKLNELGLAPGMKLFLTGVKFTKKKGFGQFSVAAYWKRKYRGKGPNEGWYILTNLKSLPEALKVYQARSGIEAMFRDCKSGGYNLEDSKASVERLTSLVLLIAIAYTCAGLQGQFIKLSGQQKYVSRLKELKRMTRRHSNFWVGLYGQMWIAALEACSDWVRDLIRLRANKRAFFQKGLRAMNQIQAAF